MIELELLGLHPDGDRLSLNDAEGNRYILPITADLRAALRKDVRSPDRDEPKPITPKEIQAHFRAGLSLAEVSELTSLPPSQLEGLAHPIFAERQYTADTARGYRQSQELGGMTLDELVVSRLVPRGVANHEISWDAYRKQEGPWVLMASYPVSGTTTTALWTLDTRAQTVVAMNDEASWLTETQIPAPTSPWRSLNTPAMDENDEAVARESRRARRHENANVLDAEPASAGRAVSIDDMLDSLDTQRGKAQPMPTDEDEIFQGAHPAASEPENATDATILALPSRVDGTEPEDSARPASERSPSRGLSSVPSHDAGGARHAGSSESSGSRSATEPRSADTSGAPALSGDAESTATSAAKTAKSDSGRANDQAKIPGMESITPDETDETDDKPKRRKGRPEMPSWDEIVFGYSKGD